MQSEFNVCNTYEKKKLGQGKRFVLNQVNLDDEMKERFDNVQFF